MSANMNIHFRSWTKQLSAWDMATLVSILRGIDVEGLQIPLKAITKQLRWLIVEPIKTSGKQHMVYMSDNILEVDQAAKVIQQAKECEHWYDHFKKVVHIIISKHPDPYTKLYYNNVVNKIISLEKEIDDRELAECTVEEHMTDEYNHEPTSDLSGPSWRGSNGEIMPDEEVGEFTVDDFREEMLEEG